MSDVPDKCVHCTKDKVFHDIQILPDGSVLEKHGCEDCAAEQGLLPNSLMMGDPTALTPAKLTVGGVIKARACEVCGTTFAEFKRIGRLGCPSCYETFEKPLSGILERSHEGGTHHVGKIPRRLLRDQESSGDSSRLEQLLGSAQARAEQMRALQERLREALDCEQYELAARIRDQIRRAGGGHQEHEPGASA